MSWGEVQLDSDGHRYQHYSGLPISLNEVFTHLGKVAPGVDRLMNVYIASPTTLLWDRPSAEIEAEEKALLKALKAKYPNE